MQTNTAPTRTRAPRLPAEQRRRQILDAAVTVFARLGYAGTGTADIAREAGIGEPTIYRYFANKRELYLAAISGGAEEVRENWERIAAEAPDPIAAVQQIGVWYYGQMQRRPELLLLRSRSFTEAPDPEALEVAREEYRGILRFVQSLFEQARAQGMLQPDADPRMLTWVFMAVGSLLDQTQMLGLQDELRPEDVLKLAALLQSVKKD